MKIKLLTALLSLQLALFMQFCVAQEEAPPAPKNAADLDFAAVSQALRARPAKPYADMTPRERAEFQENAAMEARARALAFLAEYTDDPRRWNIVMELYPESPRFVLEWGAEEEGELKPKAVDEAAAARWRERVKSLHAQMKTATDLPEEAKKYLAEMAEMEAQDKAFAARWQSGKNEKAGAFTVYDLADKPVRLSDFRGKVVVVDFWATWCGPCLAAMPHVQALAAQYKDQGVVVLALGTWDGRKGFEKFVRENQSKYPDLRWAHDREENRDLSIASKLFGVGGIPTQFVIDRKGRVVDAVLGYEKGEVILDAALAKAGIKVEPDVLAKAEADLRKRGF